MFVETHDPEGGSIRESILESKRRVVRERCVHADRRIVNLVGCQVQKTDTERTFVTDDTPATEHGNRHLTVLRQTDLAALEEVERLAADPRIVGDTIAEEEEIGAFFEELTFLWKADRRSRT